MKTSSDRESAWVFVEGGLGKKGREAERDECEGGRDLSRPSFRPDFHCEVRVEEKRRDGQLPATPRKQERSRLTEQDHRPNPSRIHRPTTPRSERTNETRPQHRISFTSLHLPFFVLPLRSLDSRVGQQQPGVLQSQTVLESDVALKRR